MLSEMKRVEGSCLYVDDSGNIKCASSHIDIGVSTDFGGETPKWITLKSSGITMTLSIEDVMDMVQTKNEKWKPKIGEHYWYIESDLNVYCNNWENSKTERRLMKVGNVFRGELDALNIVEKIKTLFERGK